MICRATAPAPLARPQRHAAENECERGHQNRPQPEPGAFERSIRQRLSVLELILGELDDQNRVLGRKTDEHNQADLRIDIAFDLHHVRRKQCSENDAAQPQHKEGSKHCYRRAEQDAERERPAFIERGEN